MKIICISDFHGRKEHLGKFTESIARESPDLILFTGDIVRGLARGEEWLESKYRGWVPNREKDEIVLEEKEDIDFYHAFYNAFGDLQIKMAMVPGNMDAPWDRFLKGFESMANPKGNIILAHGGWVKLGEYSIGGFGGEVTEYDKEDFFVLQFPGEMVRERLSRIHAPAPKIMLFHTPPLGYLDEDSGRHKGSEYIRQIIEEHKPVLAAFGHSHKARGKDFLGDTLLVNPGAMKDGNWAVVDIEKKEVIFHNVI